MCIDKSMVESVICYGRMKTEMKTMCSDNRLLEKRCRDIQGKVLRKQLKIRYRKEVRNGLLLFQNVRGALPVSGDSRKGVREINLDDRGMMALDGLWKTRIRM